MCVVNSIQSDNSVQVVCDCQQAGLVKIESELSAPSEDLELLEEASLMAQEEEGEEEEGTSTGSSSAKDGLDSTKKSSSVFVLITSLL